MYEDDGPPFTRRVIGALAVLAISVAVTACGSKQQPDSSTASTSTTGVGPPKTTPPKPQWTQTATLTPSGGLHDGQIVHVVAKGFTPNQGGLGIVECVDRGGVTGPADCDVTAIVMASSDASGTVTGEFKVTTKPTANGDCHAVSCVISVTQLSLTPTEAASVPIAFA